MNNTVEPVVRSSFNITFIKENIIKLTELIETMKSKGNNDILEHELEFMHTYPEFYNSYPFLVKKVCKGGDLSMLETMFKNLEKVESGEKSLAGVELKLGKELASQYLEPVVKKD
jgi:hypothetical protein